MQNVVYRYLFSQEQSHSYHNMDPVCDLNIIVRTVCLRDKLCNLWHIKSAWMRWLSLYMFLLLLAVGQSSTNDWLTCLREWINPFFEATSVKCRLKVAFTQKTFVLNFRNNWAQLKAFSIITWISQMSFARFVSNLYSSSGWRSNKFFLWPSWGVK